MTNEAQVVKTLARLFSSKNLIFVLKKANSSWPFASAVRFNFDNKDRCPKFLFIPIASVRGVDKNYHATFWRNRIQQIKALVRCL